MVHSLMKGLVYSALLLVSGLLSPQLFAETLPSGIWEGIRNTHLPDYFLLRISEDNQHDLYVSHLSSQLKKGRIYHFTDNDVTCENDLCHVILTENRTQNQNVELQIAIASDHLQTNYIVRDNQQRPIFPASVRLEKQSSGIPLGAYFNRNPIKAEVPQDKNTLYGLWMGTNFDDGSKAIYRINIKETGDSTIEYLTLGSRGDLAINVIFSAEDIAYDKNLPKALLRLDGKESACTKLVYEFHQNDSMMDIYKTCYIQRKIELTTTSYIRLFRAH